MDVGTRIKEERIKNGFTQEELAERLGVQKSAIAKYENGRVTNLKRSTIKKMADIFHCSPAYIMGFDNTIELDDELKQILTNVSKKIDVDYDELLDIFTHFDFARKFGNEFVRTEDGIAKCFKLFYSTYFKSKLKQDQRLRTYYDALNDIGKKEAEKRVEELTYINRYTNDSNIAPYEGIYVNAAHAIEGASEEDKQHDEDIMNDDDF